VTVKLSKLVERERKHFSLFHKLLFFVLSIC
jgi:hypothetical protein